MKISTFLFRKRRHIAVAVTLVSASVVIGCTRNQGSFSNLWGPDGFTFKDAAGKVTGLVGKDKDETAPNAASKGQSRTVSVIRPGKERVSSTGSERSGSSLLSSSNTEKARVTADNLSNPFIAVGREKPGRVIPASSDDQPQERQKQVVTADVPPWAQETATPVASKADNFVPQQATQQNGFAETFNSQMDRLRAEMKAEAGRPKTPRGDQRAGFSPQFADVPKFDETVAPNEPIDVAETLTAPEIAPAKTHRVPQLQPRVDAPTTQVVVAETQPAVLPVITPRNKRGDRSSPSAAKGMAHVAAADVVKPVEKVPAEPLVTVPTKPTPAAELTIPTLASNASNWDVAPPQTPTLAAPAAAKSTEPTLAVVPLKPEPLDPEELVVATKSVMSRDEIRRGGFEESRNAANTPFTVPVPAPSPSEFDTPATPQIPVPQRTRVSLPPMQSTKADGHMHDAASPKGGVVTADGNLELPQPLKSSTMVAQTSPSSRVPVFSNRVTQSSSISANRGPSFLNKVPKSPIAATTALESVQFDADTNDTEEPAPVHSFPKWPVPVGIAVASLFFVFARRRLRAED